VPQADDDEQEVIEFLNELRVVLPGVQVLFAFLLTVPFSARFGQLRRIDRDVYFAALLLAAGSSVLLIAPSVHARLNWRHQDKGRLIALSNPLAIIGSGLLAAGIACSIYLIADVLYRSTAAAVAAALVTLLILVTWFALPLRDRRRHPAEAPSRPER
jgi:hypothetical protein